MAVAANPIDALWEDRPAPPQAQVMLHPVSFAGEAATDKIARLQKTLGERNVDATVLSQADSIAWLLNIRGGDVAHNPVALAFAVLPATGKPQLFIDGRKLSNSVRTELSEIAEVEGEGNFAAALDAARRRARCCSTRPPPARR